MPHPYIDESTGTFYNKLGITSQSELSEKEYRLTALRSAELMTRPIAGEFDLEHMKKIHGHLFGDVYEWAGKPQLAQRDRVRRWRSVSLMPAEAAQPLGRDAGRLPLQPLPPGEGKALRPLSSVKNRHELRR